MNTHQALKLSIDMGRLVSMGYLEDLTDAEMLHRPCPGANHIKWQVGHLITSEHADMEKVLPGSMPPLPDGFAERYGKTAAASDKASDFDSKADLLQTFEQQRAATLAALDKLSDADFDRETGIPYAPNVGALMSLHGSHWLMHAGQWAVIRRQLGRPPLF
jgi:hypothetical protein